MQKAYLYHYTCKQLRVYSGTVRFHKIESPFYEELYVFESYDKKKSKSAYEIGKVDRLGLILLERDDALASNIFSRHWENKISEKEKEIESLKKAQLKCLWPVEG